MWNPGSKREWLEEAEIWQSWIMETQRDTENEMPKDTAEKFILHQSFTIRHVVPQAPNPDCVWWGYAWSYKGNRVLFVNSEIIQYIKLPPCPLHSDHLGFQPSLPHFCSISNLNYLWVKGSISLYFGVIRRKTLKLCSKKKKSTLRIQWTGLCSPSQLFQTSTEFHSFSQPCFTGNPQITHKSLWEHIRANG